MTAEDRRPDGVLSRLTGSALLAVAAAAGFSLHTPLARVAYNAGSDALTVLSLRTITACVILFLWFQITGRPWRIRGRLLLATAGVGVCMTLHSYGLLGSMQFIPVSLAILIFYTYPVTLGVISHFTAHEPLTLMRIAALAAAFIGVGIALNVSLDSLDPRGLALAAFGALMVIGTVMGSAKVMRTAGAMPATLHTLAVTGVFYWAVMLAEGGPAIPASLEGQLALIGSTAGFVIGSLCFFGAIAVIGGPRTSMVMNAEPVFTLIFAALILGEHLTPVQLFGAALVVGAIVVARMQVRRPPALE